MTGTKATLIVSVVLLVVTFVALIFNEGLISFAPDQRTREIDRINLWRANCEAPYRPDNRFKSPSVIVTAEANKLDYFAPALTGEIKIGFAPFFAACEAIGIDLSKITSVSLHAVSAQAYDSRTPAAQSHRPIDPQKLPMKFRAIGNGRYILSLPPDADIANVILTIDRLFKRAGLAEFTFIAHFMLTRELIESAQPRPAIFANPAMFHGGSFSQLHATGFDQRTTVPNIGLQGAPQLVRTIWFGDLDTMNRFISILLSTLLGIWIGAIFESVLAMTVLRYAKTEIRREVTTQIQTATTGKTTKTRTPRKRQQSKSRKGASKAAPRRKGTARK